jgi:hypothetical protein
MSFATHQAGAGLTLADVAKEFGISHQRAMCSIWAAGRTIRWRSKAR